MILVTGGTGLVGAHLLLDLSKKGMPVRALKRRSGKLDYVKRVFDHYAENSDELFGLIEWVEGDILDVPTLEEAMPAVDYVYHSAAIVSFHKADRHDMMRTNAEGTANVVNVALEKGVRKLCHVSSIAALGRAENNGVTDESTPWVNSKDNSIYSVSKYNAEKEIWRGIEEGLDAVIINPSIILGLAGPQKGSSQLFSTVWSGLRYYSSGVNGFVDVRDVVRIMIMLMESDIKGERFVVNAGNISYKEIFDKIAEVYDKPKPFVPVNRFMSGLAWRILKTYSLVSGKPPLVTKETARTASNKYRYDNSKIKNTLDYNFIEMDQTIKETANNIKKYYFE
jgi:nucleoside-diphosphate-sugar epimerase